MFSFIESGPCQAGSRVLSVIGLVQLSVGRQTIDRGRVVQARRLAGGAGSCRRRAVAVFVDVSSPPWCAGVNGGAGLFKGQEHGSS